MRPKSFAVLAAALLLVAGLAPVAAADGTLSVAANQPAPGEETTVTVTHNGTAADNASVDVVATDGNYTGEGNYTTDENGTATLPAPTENVTVEINVTYEDHQESIEAELLVPAEEEWEDEDQPFGQRVSAFVHSLLNGDEEQRRIGRLIAGWVVENNPGNSPLHAGPPADAGPSSAASNAGGNHGGGNTTASSAGDHPGNGGGHGNGPPDDPGNGHGKAKGNGK